MWDSYDQNRVSLYGTYGNNESTHPTTQAHYNTGVTLGANAIQPLCKNGQPPTGGICTDATPSYQPSVVAVFAGFSNWDIEVGGGQRDVWDGRTTDSGRLVNGHLPGEPCATQCPNLHNPDPATPYAWSQVLPYGQNGQLGDDAVNQQSLLYDVYSPATPLVKAGVVLFDGSYGGLTVDTWDPTSHYSTTQDCKFEGGTATDPECNYDWIKHSLEHNSFSEKQVQVLFFKVANQFPQCDLKHMYCQSGFIEPDAYVVETYLGNILRYLKQGIPSQGIPARYPNLKQVFLTSRIYGGYAKNPPAPPVGPGGDDGCVSPEPFAYETAFAIQRIINAQINQDNGGQVGADPYSGALNDQGASPAAPWVDWGPYLWADATNQSSNQLSYCDFNDQHPGCPSNNGDVRYGDPTTGYENFWGDHVHPTEHAQKQIADVLKQFFLGTLTGPQSYITNWVTPWAKP